MPGRLKMERKGRSCITRGELIAEADKSEEPISRYILGYGVAVGIREGRDITPIIWMSRTVQLISWSRWRDWKMYINMMCLE